MPPSSSAPRRGRAASPVTACGTTTTRRHTAATCPRSRRCRAHRAEYVAEDAPGNWRRAEPDGRRSLDDTFLAAQELRAAIADERRDQRVGADRSDRDDDAVERYLLSLLAGADEGERPAPDEVADSLSEARGLACATAVEAYREDVSTYLEDDPDPDGRRVLDRIRDHEKRLSALDGDVPPTEAERLVAACNDLHRYLTEDGTNPSVALESANERLERFD